MNILQSPDHIKFSHRAKTLFLAGGISNCPDWQKIAIDLFDKKVSDENLCIINPRRANGIDFNNEHDSTNQILWEHNYLNQAKHILFWFPRETVCPITLFELGKYVQKKETGRSRDGCSGPANLTISIGTHPEYIRKLDVKIQTMLMCDKIKINTDLESLVEDVIKQMELTKRN